MPTYDYCCDGCQYKYELFQSMTEAPRRKCPKCGKPKLRRLIGGGGGIIFKGSGFHGTDYRSESYKRGAEADKKARESHDKPAGDKGSGSDKSSGKSKSDG